MSDQLAALQQQFVADLPRIQRVARFRLRHLSAERKEEAVAEAVALAWRAYVTLADQGRDIASLGSKIAEFCARSVGSGRTLAGRFSTTDVMSRACRAKRGFWMRSLAAADEDDGPAFAEELRDEKAVSPADEGSTRIDFAAWLALLDDRRRQVAEELAAGLNTVDVARRHGVSRARVHQHRKELRASWGQTFGGP
jgi:DNA-binding NarL/FixJ family response regulator